MFVAPRRLGSWGLEVGRIGLGCMSMTGVYDVDQRQDERSEQTVRRAPDLGVTLIDTADSYGPFTNELLVGRAIRGRSDVVISTKAGLVGRSDGALLRNGRPDHIRSAVDASLRRLHLEAIDLYTLHAVDPDVPAAETWGAMASLVASGKVRALGVMSDDVMLLAQLQQLFPITAIFTEFSLWSQQHWPVVHWSADRGVGLVATSPLGRGYLTGTMSTGRRFAWTDLRSRLPQFSAESLASHRGLVEGLRQVARRHGATAAQVALAWALQQGSHIVALAGTRRPDHLEENARASELRLSDADLRLLGGEPAREPAGEA